VCQNLSLHSKVLDLQKQYIQCSKYGFLYVCSPKNKNKNIIYFLATFSFLHFFTFQGFFGPFWSIFFPNKAIGIRVGGPSSILTCFDLCIGAKSCVSSFKNFDYLNLSLMYSARKAITLIVEVAYAGDAHMILVVLTVSLVPSA
jgi:hypothetical protein